MGGRGGGGWRGGWLEGLVSRGAGRRGGLGPRPAGWPKHMAGAQRPVVGPSCAWPNLAAGARLAPRAATALSLPDAGV